MSIDLQLKWKQRDITHSSVHIHKFLTLLHLRSSTKNWRETDCSTPLSVTQGMQPALIRGLTDILKVIWPTDIWQTDTSQNGHLAEWIFAQRAFRRKCSKRTYKYVTLVIVLSITTSYLNSLKTIGINFEFTISVVEFGNCHSQLKHSEPAMPKRNRRC